VDVNQSRYCSQVTLRSSQQNHISYNYCIEDINSVPLKLCKPLVLFPIRKYTVKIFARISPNKYLCKILCQSERVIRIIRNLKAVL